MQKFLRLGSSVYPSHIEHRRQQRGVARPAQLTVRGTSYVRNLPFTVIHIPTLFNINIIIEYDIKKSTDTQGLSNGYYKY